MKKKTLRQVQRFEKCRNFKMLLTPDKNKEGVAFLGLEGLWSYDDSIGTVNFVGANAAEAKLLLHLVGGDRLVQDLFGFLVEVKEEGAPLAGRRTLGCYLLPFIDYTVVNVEDWFRQAWKPKM